MDWAVAARYLPDMWSGLQSTLLLSLAVVAVGTVTGLIAAPFRMMRSPFIRWVSWAVVNPFRIIPVLVLLVWGFYALPMALGIRFDPWSVAVWGLGLNMGAFCAEIFRKAVEEVPSEQVEAARLLGFSKLSLWRKILIPLAFKNAGIPYLNQVLQTAKLTVLAAVISVREIYHVTADIIQMTNKPLEMYTVLAGMLFVPLLIMTLVVEYFEGVFRARGLRPNWIDTGK